MKDTIKEIIDIVLKKLDKDTNINYSEEASDLIFETGNAETGYKHLKQMGGGPAVGFFQIEGWVIKDCYVNYIKYRPELQKALKLANLHALIRFSFQLSVHF